MKTNPKKPRKVITRAALRAFSLVELLVVIAVIGIIAAIAIPNIANITDSADTAKNQRNAQSVASMFAAARATGWDPPAGVTDVPTSIDALVTGVVGPNGETFKVPLTATEVTELKANAGSLTYVAAAESLEYTP